MTATLPTTDLKALVNDDMPVSVFASLRDQVWRHSYTVRIHVGHLVGGTPLNRDVVKGWIKTRVGTKELADIELARMVEEAVMGREGTDPLTVNDSPDQVLSAAIEEVASKTNLNGFYRRNGFLVFPARNIKAALREAISVAIAGGHISRDRGWGETGKGILSWANEHVFIPEDMVAITDVDGNPLTEPTGIQQRQVSVHTGTSIAREEYVLHACLQFEVRCDDDRIDQAWPTIFTVGEVQGIGSTRSQQYGRYAVVGFEKSTLSEKAGAVGKSPKK